MKIDETKIVNEQEEEEEGHAARGGNSKEDIYESLIPITKTCKSKLQGKNRVDERRVYVRRLRALLMDLEVTMSILEPSESRTYLKHYHYQDISVSLEGLLMLYAHFYPRGDAEEAMKKDYENTKQLMEESDGDLEGDLEATSNVLKQLKTHTHKAMCESKKPGKGDLTIGDYLKIFNHMNIDLSGMKPSSFKIVRDIIESYFRKDQRQRRTRGDFSAYCSEYVKQVPSLQEDIFEAAAIVKAMHQYIDFYGDRINRLRVMSVLLLNEHKIIKNKTKPALATPIVLLRSVMEEVEKRGLLSVPIGLNRIPKGLKHVTNRVCDDYYEIMGEFNEESLKLTKMKDPVVMRFLYAHIQRTSRLITQKSTVTSTPSAESQDTMVDDGDHDGDNNGKGLPIEMVDHLTVDKYAAYYLVDVLNAYKAIRRNQYTKKYLQEKKKKRKGDRKKQGEKKNNKKSIVNSGDSNDSTKKRKRSSEDDKNSLPNSKKSKSSVEPVHDLDSLIDLVKNGMGDDGEREGNEEEDEGHDGNGVSNKNRHQKHPTIPSSDHYDNAARMVVLDEYKHKTLNDAIKISYCMLQAIMVLSGRYKTNEMIQSHRDINEITSKMTNQCINASNVHNFSQKYALKGRNGSIKKMNTRILYRQSKGARSRILSYDESDIMRSAKFLYSCINRKIEIAPICDLLEIDSLYVEERARGLVEGKFTIRDAVTKSKEASRVSSSTKSNSERHQQQQKKSSTATKKRVRITDPKNPRSSNNNNNNNNNNEKGNSLINTLLERTSEEDSECEGDENTIMTDSIILAKSKPVRDSGEEQEEKRNSKRDEPSAMDDVSEMDEFIASQSMNTEEEEEEEEEENGGDNGEGDDDEEQEEDNDNENENDKKGDETADNENDGDGDEATKGGDDNNDENECEYDEDLF